MTATLWLLRHAHAGLARPGERDCDRVLDETGKREIEQLKDQIQALNISVEEAVCSPSERTRQTLQRLAPAFAHIDKQSEDERLYQNGLEGYFRTIESREICPSLLIIGHNPMIEELAFRLAACQEAPGGDFLKRGFPTAGLFEFCFSSALNLGEGSAQMGRFFVPG